MPYPHSNDLGKKQPLPKFVDQAPTVAGWEAKFHADMEKINNFKFPTDPYQGIQLHHWGNPEPQPILIPATQSHPYTFAHPYSSSEPPQMYPTMPIMQIEAYVSGFGLDKPKFRVAQKLEPWHDYTEAEVRAMLFESFQAFTEDIIQQLKGKKQ